MSKYDRLGMYLRDQGRDQVPLTFAEIERIVGTKLPKSQKHQAWWSNSTSNNVMTQIWLDAGYRTEQVDAVHRKLIFRRIAGAKRNSGMSDTARRFESDKPAGEGMPRRSPLFGALKGTFTIEEGHDLAAPALDPEAWKAALEAKLAKFDTYRSGGDE